MPEDEAEKLYKRIIELHKQLGGNAQATDIIIKRLEELAEEKAEKNKNN